MGRASRDVYQFSTASRACAAGIPGSSSGSVEFALFDGAAGSERSSQPVCTKSVAPSASARTLSLCSHVLSGGNHAAAEIRRRSTADTTSWGRPVRTGAGGTSCASRIASRWTTVEPRFVRTVTVSSVTSSTVPSASVALSPSRYRRTTRIPGRSCMCDLCFVRAVGATGGGTFPL